MKIDLKIVAIFVLSFISLQGSEGGSDKEDEVWNHEFPYLVQKTNEIDYMTRYPGQIARNSDIFHLRIISFKKALEKEEALTRLQIDKTQLFISLSLAKIAFELQTKHNEQEENHRKELETIVNDAEQRFENIETALQEIARQVSSMNRTQSKSGSKINWISDLLKTDGY